MSDMTVGQSSLISSTHHCYTHNFIRHQRQQQYKTNKTKKKKRNKTLQDKSNTTRQHNSILGLIFSTQSTNDIIGYGQLVQEIRFSITYAHRRQRKVKHFHAAGRNFFGSSIEYFHECAYNYIFQRLTTTDIQEAAVAGLATSWHQTSMRHNWKSAQVVNSHPVCDPTIRQPGFDLSRQQWSLVNRFRTEQGHCGACRRKWRLTDTLICVLVPRPRRCSTLSNPVPWQNWMAAYLGYTLRIKTLFRGWPIVVHDTHTRRRRSNVWEL